MDARSALLDLYGDHLRTWPGLRRGAAPVASLVRLLAPLGVSDPAVRTAVSRMRASGWLDAVRLPAGPGYALTARAVRRLDEAAARIYRTSAALHEWDGRWHVVVVPSPPGRSARDRLHRQLAYLGYGPLGGCSWVAPRPAPELDAVLAEAGVQASRFTATSDDDPAGLVARAWDVPALGRRYARFLEDARGALGDVGGLGDEQAFAVRLRLVHDWRQFLKVDPALPRVLLPADWPGTTAAAWFDAQSARLLPAAQRFVAGCLGEPVPDTAGPAPVPGGVLPCPRPSVPAPSRSTSPTVSPPSPSPARRA